MYLDTENLFSDKQTITAATGSYESQNILDMGVGAGRNLNPRARVFCQVTNDAVGTDATLQVKLQTCDELEGEYKDVYVSAVIPAAEIKAGTFPIAGLPLLLDVDARFVRMQYVVAGGAFSTAPVVTAGIIEDGTPITDLEH